MSEQQASSTDQIDSIRGFMNRVQAVTRELDELGVLESGSQQDRKPGEEGALANRPASGTVVAAVKELIRITENAMERLEHIHESGSASASNVASAAIEFRMMLREARRVEGRVVKRTATILNDLARETQRQHFEGLGPADTRLKYREEANQLSMFDERELVRITIAPDLSESYNARRFFDAIDGAGATELAAMKPRILDFIRESTTGPALKLSRERGRRLAAKYAMFEGTPPDGATVNVEKEYDEKKITEFLKERGIKE